MNARPFYGFVELDNGLVLDWLRFAVSGAEAERVVRAQHVHVRRCVVLA